MARKRVEQDWLDWLANGEGAWLEGDEGPAVSACALGEEQGLGPACDLGALTDRLRRRGGWWNGWAWTGRGWTGKRTTKAGAGVHRSGAGKRDLVGGTFRRRRGRRGNETELRPSAGRNNERWDADGLRRRAVHASALAMELFACAVFAIS
eukprot:1884502-Pleurochrysis_carterae.AAC.4